MTENPTTLPPDIAPGTLAPEPVLNSQDAIAERTGNRIAGDAVNSATKDLPENQRNAIRRLHGLYMDNELTSTEVSRLIGMSDSVAGLLFRNKYTAGLASVVTKIEKFFDLMDARKTSGKLQFIEVGLSRDVFSVCKTAWNFQRIGYAYGESQTGKTTALEYFADEPKHKGSVIYVRMPAGGAQSNFMIALAKKLHICVSLAIAVLRQRILDAFDGNMLLIVDEMNECTPISGPGTVGLKTINFIREIADTKKCGVLMAGTNVFRDKLLHGPYAADLIQCARRQVLTLQLPDRPDQEDLDVFAAAYGLLPSKSLAAAATLEAKVIKEDALGLWLNLLRIAAEVAAKDNETMSWRHVLSARAGQLKLARKKF